MKEIIETKLGCTISEHTKRTIDFAKGCGNPPASLGKLTEEEWIYMRSILEEMYGDSVIRMEEKQP